MRFRVGRDVERKLLSYMQIRLYNHQDIICEEGEYFDGIYMMANCHMSKIIVVCRKHQTDINLAILKQGSFIGDASVIFDIPSRYEFQIAYSRSYKEKYSRKLISIFYIEKEHIMKILDNNHRFANFLRHRALRRTTYWK